MKHTQRKTILKKSFLPVANIFEVIKIIHAYYNTFKNYRWVYRKSEIYFPYSSLTS